VQNAKRDASRSADSGGRNTNASVLNEDEPKNPVGGEAKDPRERRGRDGCVTLLGRAIKGGQRRRTLSR